MRRIFWAWRARKDLQEIESFISADSPGHAVQVKMRLRSAVERAARFPGSGRVVPELSRPDIRELIIGPYRVVYRLAGGREIHVLTIHHSARRFRGEPD